MGDQTPTPKSLVERLRSTYRGHNITHKKTIEDVASALSSAEGGGRSASVDESAMQGTDSLASPTPLSAGTGA